MNEMNLQSSMYEEWTEPKETIFQVNHHKQQLVEQSNAGEEQPKNTNIKKTTQHENQAETENVVSLNK